MLSNISRQLVYDKLQQQAFFRVQVAALSGARQPRGRHVQLADAHAVNPTLAPPLVLFPTFVSASSSREHL